MKEFQSGFRTCHAALMKICSGNKVSNIVLLDLLAVFNMINHNILINRLEKLVGIFQLCVKLVQNIY